MTFVQGAHGRDEADQAAGVLGDARGLLHLVEAANRARFASSGRGCEQSPWPMAVSCAAERHAREKRQSGRWKPERRQVAAAWWQLVRDGRFRGLPGAATSATRDLKRLALWCFCIRGCGPGRTLRGGE